MATFTDDFNRANSTDLGANWVEVSGDWSIVSNQLSPGSAGGTIILRAAGAMDTSDHSAQATIAATTAASHGVWARGNSNISQGYLWRNDGTSWNLFSVVGGSFTSIGSYAAAAAPGDVAKIQCVGSTIKGFVNGVERVSVVNSAVTTGTSVGIRSESSGSIKFDDFAAADVSSGATLGIASSTETAQPLTGAKAATIGIAAETSSAQALSGTKAGTLSLTGGVESAQPLTGSKTTALGAADATEAAQPVTGAKAGGLAFAGTLESAQALVGTKTASISPAVAIEAAQQVAGGKTGTLGAAVEVATAQAFAGAKAASLTTAASVENAQPLGTAASRTLGTATAVEAAQLLVGAKHATLGAAMETSSARLLAAQGPNEDIDVTVGAPYSPWSAGEPQAGDWKVGAPW